MSKDPSDLQVFSNHSDFCSNLATKLRYQHGPCCNFWQSDTAPLLILHVRVPTSAPEVAFCVLFVKMLQLNAVVRCASFQPTAIFLKRVLGACADQLGVDSFRKRRLTVLRALESLGHYVIF